MLKRGSIRAAAIIALALALRLGAAVMTREPLDRGDTARYEALADNGGMSAVQAPLYPLFLRLVHAFSGPGDHRAVFIVQGLLGALAAACVYLFAARTWNERAATAAGLIAAIYPNFIIYGCTVLPDALILLLAAGMLAVNASGATAWARSSAAGVIMGIGVMIRPWFIFLALGWLVTARRRLLFVAAFAIALVPLAARNSTLAGRFVPVYAPEAFNVNIGRYESAADGWARFDLLYDNAMTIVRWFPEYEPEDPDAHPERGALFFLRKYSYIAVWLLGAAGMARHFRREQLGGVLPFAVFWILLIVLVPLANARYRTALEPLVVAYAGALLAGGTRTWDPHSHCARVDETPATSAQLPDSAEAIRDTR